MDGITFKEWVFSILWPHKNSLIGCKVASHFNPKVMQQCEGSGVDFVC